MIFIGAALSAFLFMLYWPKGQISKRWFLVLAIIALIATVLLLVINIHPTSFGYKTYQFVKSIGGPLGLQFVLGLGFGYILHSWITKKDQKKPEKVLGQEAEVQSMPPHWIERVAHKPSLMAVLAGGGIFSGIPIGLDSGNISTALTLNNAVYFHVEDVKIEKFLTLSIFVNMHKHIEAEIEYLSISKKQENDFEKSNKHENDIRILRKSKLFYDYFITPLAACVQYAKIKQYNIPIIVDALRPVRESMEILIFKEEPAMQDSHQFVSEVKNAIRTISDRLNLTEKQGIIEKEENICKKAFENKKGCKERQLCSLEKWPEELGDFTSLKKSPYIPLALSGLIWFEQNPDGAIDILLDHTSSNILEENIDINRVLGFLFLYSKGHTEEEAQQYYDNMLLIAKKSKKEMEYARHTKLSMRYEKAMYYAMNSIAYYLARTNKSKFIALDYAQRAYEFSPKKANYIDTLGYVKMAFAARSKNPDINEIRVAQSLFEDALNYAKQGWDGKGSNYLIHQSIEPHIQQAQEILTALQ